MENAAGHIKALERMEKAGYEAYLVGGCVRDQLMGRSVHDHDITTSAMPEQVMEVFSDCTVIPTGIKHGTVTVIFEGEPLEITTFRVDGSYSDSRRPDNVSFTTDIRDDLSRRDFTMNAIAASADGRIVDPFGGSEDIEKGVIRCVGDPEKRFNEDALRILRAVRFAAQLGFAIDEETAAAVHGMKSRLGLISAERIRDEIDKLICGRDCIRVMLEYSDVITEVIPELSPSVGFDQHSPYHKYDVWEHTVRAVDAAPDGDLLLRRTMLFHDVAKPACARFDENGRGHFKRHAPVGADMAGGIMKRLRYDNKSIAEICTLIRHHADKFYSKPDLKRLVSEIGIDTLFRLIEVKKLDNLAKNEFVLEENLMFDGLAQTAREFLEAGECCTLKELAVNGSDLREAGLSGTEIGAMLHELLEQVITEKLPNSREELLAYAGRRCRQ
ncbi:MAG: CCA tRNA nucleotidyltransferase [Ruminococcus sp.]|nr:CCA tRNA nucleotidyltransferase [Ruminococcus sp.]